MSPRKPDDENTVVPKVAMGSRDTGACAADSTARTPNNRTPHDASSNTNAALASGAKARFISPKFNIATFAFKCFRETKAGDPSADSADGISATPVNDDSD